jgi:hypothetical protein
MDVSCMSAISCWVSGALVPKPIAWGQDFALAMSRVHGLLAVTDDQGQSWQTVAPSPSLDIGAVPAVSCPDPTTCFALGYQHTGSGPGGFVLLSEGS